MKDAVLIIEDDQWVASYMADVIKMFFQLNVFIATSAAMALDVWRASRSQVALIISDLTLPDEPNAEKFICDLTRHAPEIPLVFVTGNFRDFGETAKSLGRRVAILPKPFGPIDLQGVLKPFLEELPKAAA